jgi:hypothetical protein
MFCSRCHTPNFRSDRFCRHCGGRLPAAGPVAPMDEQVEEHLRKALALLDQGNANDALVAAQAALALEPSSPFGHSVLAHVYDRQGRTAEAIQQLEIVLRVHPQSTADREKLAALTEAAAPIAVQAPAPSRRPLLIAAAAACVVTLFGGIYLGMNARRQEEAVSRGTGTNTLPGRLETQAPAGPHSGTTTAGSVRPLIGPPAPTGLNRTVASAIPGLNGPGAPPQYPSPQAPTNTALPSGRIGLPPVYNQPRGVTGAGAIGLPPAVIGEISPLTPEQPAATQGADNGNSASPTPVETTAAKPEAGAAEPIETDSGFIRVQRTKRNPEAPGTPASTRNQGPPPSISISFGEGGAESLLLEAQREESRAEEAAKTGNQSEALRRYRNAQRLYENIARRGGGEAQAARAGAENCRRALAAL